MLNDIYFMLEKIENEKIQKELEEELKKVTQWHKKTFPNADKAGQLLKLEEELKEAKQSQTEKEAYKELADVFIVLAGLDRFKSFIGGTLYGLLCDEINSQEKKALLKAIREKMKINRARKWDKLKDGRFKHK